MRQILAENEYPAPFVLLWLPPVCYALFLTKPHPPDVHQSPQAAVSVCVCGLVPLIIGLSCGRLSQPQAELDATYEYPFCPPSSTTEINIFCYFIVNKTSHSGNKDQFESNLTQEHANLHTGGATLYRNDFLHDADLKSP